MIVRPMEKPMEKERTIRIVLEMPMSLYDEVIEYRFTRRVPSRVEAFRRLLRLGLHADREGDMRVGSDA